MSNLSSRQLLFAKLAINLDGVPKHTLDDYIAVQNYLTDEDRFPSDTTNGTDDFSIYLSAFYHLRKVNDLERIKQLLKEVPELTACLEGISELVTLLNQLPTSTRE